MISLQNKCPECDGPLGDSSNHKCWLCNLEKPVDPLDWCLGPPLDPPLHGQILTKPVGNALDCQPLSGQVLEKGWIFIDKRASTGSHPQEIKTGFDSVWIYGGLLAFWIFVLIMFTLNHL